MINFTDGLNSPMGLVRRVPAAGGRIDTLVTNASQHFSSVIPLPGGHGVLATLATGGTFSIALPGGVMKKLVNS